MTVKGSFAFPIGAFSLSMVCDCGISWLHSLGSNFERNPTIGKYQTVVQNRRQDGSCSDSNPYRSYNSHTFITCWL